MKRIVAAVLVFSWIGVANTSSLETVSSLNFTAEELFRIEHPPPEVVNTIAVGDEPNFLAVTPSGDRLFVLNARSHTISVVDTELDGVIATYYTWPIRRATSLAVAPDGTTLIVVGSRPNGSGHALIFDAASGQLRRGIRIGAIPLRIAISTDSTLAFIACSASGWVDVINLVKAELESRILIGSHPHSLALSPDGRFLYVVQSVGRRLSVVDIRERRVVEELILSRLTRLTDISLSTNGRYAYVVDGLNEGLWVINLVTLSVEGGIQLGIYPYALSQVGGDGFLYVAHRSEPGVPGQVSVVQTIGTRVEGMVTAGLNPFAVAALPNGSKIYVANSGDDTVTVMSRHE
ncbi:MAG: YncE family protein [Parcubacteria group bacterium]|nr:YncE family protein [Parcubacteria group bacterium]